MCACIVGFWFVVTMEIDIYIHSQTQGVYIGFDIFIYNVLIYLYVYIFIYNVFGNLLVS